MMKIFTFCNGEMEPGALVRFNSFSSDSIPAQKIPTIVVGASGYFGGYSYCHQYLEFRLTSHDQKRSLEYDKCLRVLYGDIEDSELDCEIFSSFARKRISALSKPDDSGKAICVFEAWGNGEFGYNYPLGLPAEIKDYRDSYGILHKRQTFDKFSGYILSQGDVKIEKTVKMNMEPGNRIMLIAVIEKGGYFTTPTAKPMSRPQFYAWNWNGKYFTKIAEIM